MPRKQLSPPGLTWQTRDSGQPHIKKSRKITKITTQQSNVKELNWNKKIIFLKNKCKKQIESAKVHLTNSQPTKCDRDKKINFK